LKIFRSKEKNDTDVVGIISRLDWGRNGFRLGLVERVFEDFAEKGVDFIIIAGGIISWPALRNKMKEELTHRIATKKKEAALEERVFNKARAAKASREDLIKSWASRLAQIIPRIKRNGKFLKIYLIISQSMNYDGPWGRELARQLARKRRDIRFWGDSQVDFPLQKSGKLLSIITPRKISWRSKYYSTAVDRLVEDAEKQRSKPLPNVWVVGCTASSTIRPEGNRLIVSVPALHNLEEVSVSENAIGGRIIKVSSNETRIITISRKDLVSRERNYLNFGKLKESEKKLAYSLTEPMTIGMLSERSGLSRRAIAETIKSIEKRKGIPNIVFDPESGLYDWDARFFQKKLKYPKVKPVEELKAVIFGCLHVGSVFTDYEFVSKKLPKILIDSETEYLIGAGDFIEGIEHNLILRGEVLVGMNYTDQEKYSGYLIAKIIFDVFKSRFEKNYSEEKNLEKVIKQSLITFIYIPGNHDAWVEKHGMKPLERFRHALVGKLVSEIETLLQKKKLFFYVRNLVKEKIKVINLNQPTIQLGSIKIGLRHPGMARTKTTSIRSQEALDKDKSVNVIAMANFHVAIVVEQWEEKIGNRIAIQAGTLVHKTYFEEGKMKNVHFGVIAANIKSAKGRIVETEIKFEGLGANQTFMDNSKIIQNIMKKFV